MLLFLDIDGVMVPAKSWQRPAFLEDGFPEFSARAVNVLQHLISDTTTVLLTTSHKARFNTTEWISLFRRRAINISKLDTLEVLPQRSTRKDEILNWFDKNNTEENFIIIDDDKSLNDLPKHLKRNLILTSSSVGLTSSHMQEIASIHNR